jgi:hypothetical protein
VNNVDVAYFGLYLFPMDGLMTSTFGNYLLYYRYSALSLVLLCDVSITTS